jgi:uncharacterized protein YebE (UPF0316 family)
MLWLSAYFLIGLIVDALATVSLIYIVKQKTIHATTFSFIGTFLSMVMLSAIVNIVKDGGNIFLADLFYSAGVGVGTCLGMKIHFEKIPHTITSIFLRRKFTKQEVKTNGI